jgi:hypothetical protein
MDKNIAESVQEINESVQDAFFELADVQLALVGGGIGDTAV